MNTETMTVEKAIQRLSDTSTEQQSQMKALETQLTGIQDSIAAANRPTTNNLLPTDLTKLEAHMTECMETINGQHLDWQKDTLTKIAEGEKNWSCLTDFVRSMNNDLQKITALLTGNGSNNLTKPTTDEPSTTPYTGRETSTPIHTPQFMAHMTQTLYQEQHADTHNVSSTQSTPPPTPIVHTVVVPPTSAIPVFHGKLSENPRQFLIRVKEYAQTVNKWSDTLLLNGISQFLRDSALEWYCQLRLTQRQPQSWIEFNAQFLTQFNSPIRRAKQEQEWRECHQRPNETINEFVVRLRTLWSEQKPRETEIDFLRHLRCKMRNDLLTMIGVSKGESLDEIILEAQKVEEILYQRSRNSHLPPSTHSVFYNSYSATTYHPDNNYYDSKHHTPTYQSQTTRSYKNRTDTLRSRGYAPKQRQSPHYSNQNPATNQRDFQYNQNTTKCYTCGQNGHIAWDCPNRYDTEHTTETWHYPKNDNGTFGNREPTVPQ